MDKVTYWEPLLFEECTVAVIGVSKCRGKWTQHANVSVWGSYKYLQFFSYIMKISYNILKEIDDIFARA
jgi:hypothetical protein